MPRKVTNEPVVFDCTRPLLEGDVRALRKFIFDRETFSETELHRFLERHPAVIGALGFIAFASEFPLLKRDGVGDVLSGDDRRRDRADLVAARDSPIPGPSGEIVRFAHLIELKGPRARFSVNSGERLSDGANRGVEQLNSYEASLREMSENRIRLARLGWSIRAPRKLLIMGSRLEFEGRPAALEALQGRVRDQGVEHFLIEDLLDKLGDIIGVPVLNAEALIQKDQPVAVFKNILNEDLEWMTSFDRDLARLWNQKDRSAGEGQLLSDMYHEQQRVLGTGE